MLERINFFNIVYIFRKNVKSAFFNAWSYIFVKIFLGFSVLINILVWLIARFIKVSTGTNQIALHYNVDFGIDFYGNAVKIFIIPVLGLIIILFNFLIIMFLQRNKDIILISYILLIVALLSNIVLLAAISSVYLINFR